MMITCTQVAKQFVVRNSGAVLCWAVETLTVAKGERVLVSGPSGCGKTTLLNLLAGLLRPDHGAITIADVRIDELDTASVDYFRGLHIGLIFQALQLLSPLSVLDNLLLGARFGRRWSPGEARDRAEHLLARVGLADRRTHRPGELSLGEQQRVAIARALINEPPLLLADEPTASLDARNAGIVLDLLFALSAEHGATLVAVSHDPTVQARFDRVIDATPWMQRAPEVTLV